MSGGFTPKLKHTGALVHPEAAVVASEHAMFKSVGITLDASLVGADADGNKILKAGTVIGKVTTSGKHGAYNNSLNDGRETAVGVLPESVNLRDGDVITNLLIHGSVYAARTSGLDTAARTDLAGRIIFQ